MALKLTTEQMGRLLFKAKHEPRKNQKRYLKDQGGEGSAEELDAILLQAGENQAAIAERERLEEQRRLMSKTVELGVDGRVAEMLADVQVKIQDQKLSQQDVANACGWPQSLVSAYLNGTKEPGAKNLAKLATAVGCVWRLTPAPGAKSEA